MSMRTMRCFFSVEPAYAFEATKVLVDSLESPYTYHGTSLVMPPWSERWGTVGRGTGMEATPRRNNF